MAIYNGETKVAGGVANAMITLTKAQYDALSESEKADNIYMTTDEVESMAVATTTTAGLMASADKVIVDGASAPVAWTPTDASGAGLTFTTNNTCSYIKVGKLVTILFDINFPTTSNTAYAMLGLPFVRAGNIPIGTLGYHNFGAFLMMHNGNFYNVTGNAQTNANLSGKRISGCITYFTT